MKVYEVIETKEMFRGEIIEDYCIYYEQTETKVFAAKDQFLFQKESFVVSTVNVYKGNAGSSLQKVKVYSIEDIMDIRQTILNDFPHLFKKEKLAG